MYSSSDFLVGTHRDVMITLAVSCASLLRHQHDCIRKVEDDVNVVVELETQDRSLQTSKTSKTSVSVISVDA